MRRDLKISVSRKNRDIFAIWHSMQIADPNPSSTAIRWMREGYTREWKKKVLSQPQQKVDVMTTPKYVKPQKTDAEIKIEKELKEAEQLKKIEEKRLREVELANIRRIIKKQD